MEANIDNFVLTDLKERATNASKHEAIRDLEDVDNFDFDQGWHAGFASGIGYAIRKLGLSDKLTK
jgi:hypothetical protein